MRRLVLVGTLIVWLAMAASANATPKQVSTAPNGNFWLVKTPPTTSNRPSDQHPTGDATVENLPPGQRPASKDAVYLGSTTTDIGVHLQEAAHKLGLNPAASNIQNPFAKAAIGDVLGTFGIVAVGLAAAPVIAAAGGADAAAGGAAGAAKGATGLLGDSSANPTDSPAMVFRTSALAAGAALFAGSVAHMISSSQAVDLQAGWFQSVWGRIIAVGAMAFAALGLLATLLVATPRGDGEMVRESLKGVVEAAAITFSAVAVVSLSLVAVDELCAAIGGSDLQAAGTMMKALAGLLGALALAAKATSLTGHASVFNSLLGTPAWFVAVGALIGTGLTMLDLVFRNLAIFLAMLFLPLAAATRTFPALKSWSRRLMRFLAAVVVSKLVLVIAITAAAAMILHGGLSGLLYGTLLVLVIGFVPFMLYGLVGLVEHLAFHGRNAAKAGAGAVAAESARDTVAQRRREIASTQQTREQEAMQRERQIEVMERMLDRVPPQNWGPDGPVRPPVDEPSLLWDRTSSPTREFGVRRPRPEAT